jgi:spoIIIJ-associated protein
MEELEITAGTVEEATEEAEKKLGLNREKLNIEIVNKGRQGLLFKEQAVIRVKPLANPDENVAEFTLKTVQKLLSLLEVSAVVHLSADDSSINLDIEGDDLGILIGRGGCTLMSLQYIIRTIVSRQSDEWVPLSIDVCGFHKRRQERLRSLALSLARQVRLRHRTIALRPMPADERRLIHLALADHPDIITHSTGEGKNRRVEISLRQD